MSECVFCLIVKGQAAVEDLRKHGPGVYSFVPLNPVTPGHRLFVPAYHDLNAGWGPMHAASAFEDACDWGHTCGDEYNIITSAGRNATQSIFHTHIHYVPRRKGDGLKLPWSE